MARDAVLEVRERTDMVELVGTYVQLKRTGRSYKGLCPFHQEKTPSFIVFPDSQNFQCFGCGKGGDLFTFYMEVEHVDFREALTELARRAGVELSEIPTVAPEVDAHRNRLIELNELAATFYANILVNTSGGEVGRKLADDRGLNAEMIERFRLGFAFESWDALLRFLQSRNVDPELAAEAGLLQTRESGGFYDRFRSRFMFPIRNRDGRIVGFGGRAIGDAQPKYLNSPQSAIFDKSSLLYGFDLAKDAVRKQDQIVIVEGYMDAIAAHQFGHANVVAQMGTALTAPQVDLAKRLTRNIVLALDSDVAGQMATERGLDALREGLTDDDVPVLTSSRVIQFERKLNAEIKIVQLPMGKDPDELIRNSPELWPSVVAEAKPFLDVLLDVVTASVGKEDGRGKSEAVARLAPVLRSLSDRVVQSHYVSRLASRLGIDERVIQSEINRRNLTRGPISTPSQQRQETSLRPVTMVNPAAETENHLISLLLAHRLLCRDVIEEVRPDDILDVRNRLILNVLKDPLLPDLNGEAIVIGLDESIADYGERLLEQLATRPGRTVGNVRQEATLALRALQREHYTRLLKQLDQGLRAAQQAGDIESVTEITRQMGLLLARHQTINPPPSPYFRDTRDGRQVR